MCQTFRTNYAPHWHRSSCWLSSWKCNGLGALPGPYKSSKAPAEQYLSVIRRECDRLSRLIENLLDFAKIERGVKQYHFDYEDLTIVLCMAVESFRPHAEAQGFRLDIDIVEPLPEIRLDADAMAQVVLNLLSNAVKYSDDVKEIRVQAYRHGSHVVIAVTDRGIGIDAAEIPKIFDDFYRVDQRLNTPKQGGMGLGLTLVRHMVQAHGGSISVRSEVGKGSTFSVMLPIPAEDMATVKTLSAVPGDAQSTVPGQPRVEMKV